MTVRELRQLLFDMMDQEAKVVVVRLNDIKGGHVKQTHDIITQYDEHGRATLGHADDPSGYVSLLIV